MLNDLIKSERAARDAFLTDDYFDGAIQSHDEQITGLVETLWFSTVTVFVCATAMATAFLII